MPTGQNIQIQFPIAGLDESAGYQSRPPYSSPSLNNVLPRDSIEGRERGGSRPGMGGWLLTGSTDGVVLGAISLPSQILGYERREWNFKFNSPALSSSYWSAYGGAVPTLPTHDEARGAYYVAYNATRGGKLNLGYAEAVAPKVVGELVATIPSYGHDRSMFMLIGPEKGAWVNGDSFTLDLGMDDTGAVTANGIRVVVTATGGQFSCTGTRYVSSSAVVFANAVTTAFVSDALLFHVVSYYDFAASRQVIRVMLGDQELSSYTVTLGQEVQLFGSHGFQVTTASSDATRRLLIHEVGVGGIVSKRLTTQPHILLAGVDKSSMKSAGKPYSQAASYPQAGKGKPMQMFQLPTGRIMAIGATTTGLWTATGGTFHQVATASGGYIDGFTTVSTGVDPDDMTAAYYSVEITANDGTCLGLLEIDTGSTSSRMNVIDRLGGGATTYSLAHARCVSMPAVFYPYPNNPVGVSPTTTTGSRWIAAANRTTLGRFPGNAIAGCVWGGRVVLVSPYSWHMSRVDDETDWLPVDPATDAEAPIAGVAVTLGDEIVSVVPLTSDYLLVGGRRTTWVFKGDPAAGGTFELLSRGFGIASPNAYFHDEDGSVVVLCDRGVFRILGTNITAITTSMPRRLQAILGRWPAVDFSMQRLPNTPFAVLICRNLSDSLFVTSPGEADDGRFYMLDLRSGAWFPQTYALAQQNFTLRLGAMSRLLLPDLGEQLCFFDSGGGMYIMRPEFRTDHGYGFDCVAQLGPFMLGSSPIEEGIMHSADFAIDRSSGPIAVEFRTGESAQAVANPSSTFDSVASITNTATLTAGVNYRVHPRLRGVAGAIKLTSDSEAGHWAMESVVIERQPGGMLRRP